MNLIYVFATVVVFLWSYYVNKAYVRCCYERRGYIEDLRRVNRLLYLLPTICSIIAMVGFCISTSTSNPSDKSCSTHVSLILAPLCLWVTATFVKTSNVPPDQNNKYIQVTAPLRTPRRPRNFPVPRRTDTGPSHTVSRHPFAEPAESFPPSRSESRRKEFEMDTLGRGRVSYDGSAMDEETGSDLASASPLHVETVEEGLAYRRAALTLLVFLAIMFMYGMLAGNIESDPAFVLENCDIGQLQVLHIIPMAVLFAIISFAAMVRAFGTLTVTYTVQTCRRASLLCLVCSILMLVWFSQESLFRRTGGVFLVIMNVVIAFGQQIVWGAPYIAGLAGSASAIANNGRRAQQPEEPDDEDYEPNTPAWPLPRRRDTALVDTQLFAPVSSPGDGDLHDFETLDALVPEEPVVTDRRVKDKEREVQTIMAMLRDEEDDTDDDDDEDVYAWTQMKKPENIGVVPMQRLPSEKPRKPSSRPWKVGQTPSFTLSTRAPLEQKDLSGIMNNAPALIFLYEFMQQRKQDHLLEFIINFEIDFPHMTQPKITQIEWMYNTFIADGGSKSVPISAQAREICMQRLNKLRLDVKEHNVGVVNLSDTPFKAATSEVHEHISTSVWAEFLESEQYKQYLSDAPVPAESEKRIASPGWYKALERPSAPVRLIVCADNPSS